MPTKISQLPAGQTINNVSGTLEYKATGDIKLNPGSGFIIQANNAQLIQTCTSSGTTVLRAKLAADTNYRFGCTGDGILGWGGGASLEDTYLSRTGTKTLNLKGVGSTDAILDVTGNVFSSAGIGIGNTSLTSSTLFQITSTTKGSAPYPSMTTAQRNAIVAPFAGLGIYNTDNLAVEVYDGTNWEQGDGNVTGPNSATDNAVALYNGTTGKIIKNSNLTYSSNVLATTSGDLGFNAFTGFVRFNSNTLTGIATAIGTALDFTSLINTNVVGTTSLTIGSAIGQLRLSVGSGQSIDALNSPFVNVYSTQYKGAGNGDTVISTRYTTDTGDRFYIENTGNHWWCTAGDGVITHLFNIDAGTAGKFVLSDSGGTAGTLTCITEVLTNQITGTSSNNLTLTTNDSSKNVVINRIPVYSSLNASITAHAGGGQANATVLANYFNYVTTVASAGDSVKTGTTSTMPVNSEIVVVNSTATSMDLYPDSGSSIFFFTDQGTNNPIAVAAGNVIRLYRVSATVWVVI